MSSVAIFVIASPTLVAALAAATMPKLIHAALCFAAAFIGVAALYFWLGAEFVGLVQVFVYVGAVAVLIVFTILLTRRDMEKSYALHWSGVLIAPLVFGGLLWAILKTPGLASSTPPFGIVTVRQIGQALMTDYVWPLQCVGVVLTAALVGALVLVMEEKR
jgi:NADH-quinone oxidoreductase subunit J